jgi:hypothetical protein
MRVSKGLVYCNVASMIINVIIIGLMVVKVCAPIIGILLVIGFMASAVWLSCYANGKLPKKAKAHTFYSAPTEGRKVL